MSRACRRARGCVSIAGTVSCSPWSCVLCERDTRQRQYVFRTHQLRWRAIAGGIGAAQQVLDDTERRGRRERVAVRHDEMALEFRASRIAHFAPDMRDGSGTLVVGWPAHGLCHAALEEPLHR